MFPISVCYLRVLRLRVGLVACDCLDLLDLFMTLLWGVRLLVVFVSLLGLMCGDFGCLLILLVVLQLLSYRRCIRCGYYFGYYRFDGFGGFMGLLMIAYVGWRDGCGAHDLGFSKCCAVCVGFGCYCVY